MFSIFIRGQIRSISNIRVRKHEGSKLCYVEAIDATSVQNLDSSDDVVYLGEQDIRQRAEDKVWEVMHRINNNRSLDSDIIDVSDLRDTCGISVLLYLIDTRWCFQRDYLTRDAQTAKKKATYYDKVDVETLPHIIFTTDSDVEDSSDGRIIFEKYNDTSAISIPKSLIKAVVNTFNKDDYSNIQTADELYFELD